MGAADRAGPAGIVNPSAIFAPCDRCGVFPGGALGYKCLCHHDDASLRAIVRMRREGTTWSPLWGYVDRARAELDRRTS